MHVKCTLGEAEIAAACYAKILASGIFIFGEREQVMSKMREARQLCAEVRAIIYAPQAALLNTVDERERLQNRPGAVQPEPQLSLPNTCKTGLLKDSSL